MKMLIPISVTLPNSGQRFFPRNLRGKLLNESEARKVWKAVVEAPVKQRKARTPKREALSRVRAR